MKKYQIKRRINIAIDTLRVNDNYLLKNDVNERSITHRLAIYLENTFGKEYDVDCEYNKNCMHSTDRKTIDILYRDLMRYSNSTRIQEMNLREDEWAEKFVYPDIIVHKRGENNSNLLIIEVKKSSNQEGSEFDECKLKAYTSQSNMDGLNYKYGIFIKFFVNQDKYKEPEIRYFVNGSEVKNF